MQLYESWKHDRKVLVCCFQYTAMIYHFILAESKWNCVHCAREERRSLCTIYLRGRYQVVEAASQNHHTQFPTRYTSLKNSFHSLHFGGKYLVFFSSMKMLVQMHWAGLAKRAFQELSNDIFQTCVASKLWL